MNETFETLVIMMDKEIDIITQNLTAGSARDYAEYRNIVGTVRGLRIAQDLITGLAKNMEHADE